MNEEYRVKKSKKLTKKAKKEENAMAYGGKTITYKRLLRVKKNYFIKSNI